VKSDAGEVPVVRVLSVALFPNRACGFPRTLWVPEVGPGPVTCADRRSRAVRPDHGHVAAPARPDLRPAPQLAYAARPRNVIQGHRAPRPASRGRGTRRTIPKPRLDWTSERAAHNGRSAATTEFWNPTHAHLRCAPAHGPAPAPAKVSSRATRGADEPLGSHEEGWSRSDGGTPPSTVGSRHSACSARRPTRGV
jgi:hypothetical protein